MLIILFKTALICPLAALGLVIACCNLLLALYVKILVWVYTDPYTQLLKRKLVFATSISEYAAVAVELDRRIGTDCWKRDAKSHSYDYHRLQLWQKSLSIYLEQRAHERICDVITQAQKVYHGGAFSPDVYSYTYWNTKEIIINYHKLLTEALDVVTEAVLSVETPTVKQLSFVSQITTSWGKAALVLEGKRPAMYYHFGICKGLLHLRCVPHFVYAKESNALLGAWLVLNADNAAPDDTPRSRGEDDVLLAIKLLKKPCRWYGLSFRQRKRILAQLSTLYGDITLLEAYNLSGRQLNLICKRNGQFYVMNQKTTPDVSIASAVLACVCEDVLQPTGGGTSYPLLLGGSSAEKPSCPGTLWGIIVKEESWLPVIFPPALQVGRPNDGLSGTAGREVVGIVYAIRQLFRDLLRQLLTILFYNQVGTMLPVTRTQRFGGFTCLITRAAIPAALRYLRLASVGEDVSDLLTPQRSRVLVSPQTKWFSSRERQIATGLTTVFQNACLIRVRLDVEKSIATLVDAVAQTDSTAC